MKLEELFPKDLYQSYVIEGDPISTASELVHLLEFRGEIESQSPDVLCQMYESFTIDDSNKIKEWHSQLGISNGKKICIIGTNFINREAEQSLLKTIEEPGERTHFFIIVPDSSLLVDTILSRTQLIKIESDDNLEIKKLVISFVKAEVKDRMDMIAVMIKENKSEDSSGQLRHFAISFINELEKIIYKKFKDNVNDKNNLFILEEIRKTRDFLSLPGAGVKMILEHLAIMI